MSSTPAMSSPTTSSDPDTVCHRPDLSAARLGVLGGSGLYAMDGLEQIEELEVDTPYGRPSDSL